MFIGAFDPAAWTGLVLSDGRARGFGLRLVVERDGERADGKDILYLVTEVGPHAPDGSYARLGVDTTLPFAMGAETPLADVTARPPTLRWEWSRIDTHTAVARGVARFDGVMELRAYFPWDWSGRWRDGTSLTGRTHDDGLALAIDLHVDRIGSPMVPEWRTENGEAVCRIPTAADASVSIRLAVGETEHEARARAGRVAWGDLADLLHRAARRYRETRVTVEGTWDGLAECVTNSLHWTVSLKPESGRLYTPAGRRWIFPARDGGSQHWTTFCWDSCFNALQLALDCPALANEALAGVFETQYPSGNVPNWRGRFDGTPDRSQPPVGSFATLKTYLRTGERSLLEYALPFLERWSAWWRADKRGRPRRDGNANGLFEWGSDLGDVIDSPAAWENAADHRQKAAWESGQDDLPNWDDAVFQGESETLNVDAVDLNAYLVLDYECLSLITAELGLAGKASTYRTMRDGLAARMNEHLWNGDVGLYVDRFWDGTFSTRYAATSFLPMLAGVPDPARASRMVEVLQDDTVFWGDYVIPSVSRSDPAFSDQQYWRGTIWPPVNYLVYQGLRRYGFDREAGELAAKGVDLVLEGWRRHQVVRENYDGRTGEGAGHRHQSWGPLLALIGIEEFIDVTPWDGLRVGSLAAVGSTLRRAVIGGHEWTVERTEGGLRVHRDGHPLVQCDRPIVLRHLDIRRGRLSASAHCSQPSTLQFPLATAVTVNGGAASVGPRADLAPGHHELRVVFPANGGPC